MTAIVQVIFYVFLGYFGLGLFMWYFSSFFYFIGYGLAFLAYPLNIIDKYWFTINPVIYALYSSLIFVLLYKVFKSVFINKK